MDQLDSKKSSDLDYYSILGLSKKASNSDIKTAYRKLAIKWHPDKNPMDREAEKMFQQIAQAYSVLSDPDHKYIYDSQTNENSKESGHKFNSKEVFDSFFGEQNPFTKLRFGESTKFCSKENKPLKMDDVKSDLPCTLEELCIGAEKQIKVTRVRYSSGKTIMNKSKILCVKLKPGMKAGTEIKFDGEGDEGEARPPGDLIFVIKETSHQIFTQEDSNLVFTARITLLQALTDCNIKVPTLTGKSLLIPCPEVIHCNYERQIIGEGMPNQIQESRGDLIIRFYIEFPKVLNSDVKKKLKHLLTN